METGTVRLEVGETKNKDGRLIYLTQELHALLIDQWQSHQASILNVRGFSMIRKTDQDLLQELAQGLSGCRACW